MEQDLDFWYFSKGTLEEKQGAEQDKPGTWERESVLHCAPSKETNILTWGENVLEQYSKNVLQELGTDRQEQVLPTFECFTLN